MEMRSSGSPCISSESDALTLGYFLTNLHVLLGEVPVDCLLVFMVLDSDEHSVASLPLISDLDNRSSLGGQRISVRERRVDESSPVVDTVMPFHSVLRVHGRVLTESLRDIYLIYRVLHVFLIKD